jgi:hypothetical protein
MLAGLAAILLLTMSALRVNVTSQTNSVTDGSLLWQESKKCQSFNKSFFRKK